MFLERFDQKCSVLGCFDHILAPFDGQFTRCERGLQINRVVESLRHIQLIQEPLGLALAQECLNWGPHRCELLFFFNLLFGGFRLLKNEADEIELLFGCFLECLVVLCTALGRGALTRLDKYLPELVPNGPQEELREAFEEELIDRWAQVSSLALLINYLCDIFFGEGTDAGLGRFLAAATFVRLALLLLLRCLLLGAFTSFITSTFIVSARGGGWLWFLFLLLLLLVEELVGAESLLDAVYGRLLRPLHEDL